MLKRQNHQTLRQNHQGNNVQRPEGLNFFYFTMSEKGHEIFLPAEEESAWEQLHNITWDPATAD